MAGPQVTVWYWKAMPFLRIWSRTPCCRLLPVPLSFAEAVSWSVGRLARRQVPSSFRPCVFVLVGWLPCPVRPGLGSPCCDGYEVGWVGIPPVCLSFHGMYGSRCGFGVAPSGLAGSVAMGDARGCCGLVGTSAGLGSSTVPSWGTVLLSHYGKYCAPLPSFWVICLHPWSLLVLMRLCCGVWLVPAGTWCGSAGFYDGRSRGTRRLCPEALRVRLLPAALPCVDVGLCLGSV